MRNNIFAIVMLTGLGLLFGCSFEGAEYTEDLDLVATNYDAGFDFASKGTYFLPDTIWKITGELVGGKESIKDIYAIPMLAKIDENMQALGWTKVLSTDNPDIHLFPAAWTSTTIIYGGYGGYYCWYYPYYCGGGWYYPYYGGYSTSYSTGTLLMTIVDPNQVSVDDTRRVVWTAAINGLLSGSYDINRITKGIDQTFNQSPYLKTN